MGENLTFTFRPRDSVKHDYVAIEEWCAEMGYSMSAIFNSYIPAIKQALTDSLYINDDTGEIFARSDFGDIKICKRYEQ